MVPTAFPSSKSLTADFASAPSPSRCFPARSNTRASSKSASEGPPEVLAQEPDRDPGDAGPLAQAEQRQIHDSGRGGIGSAFLDPIPLYREKSALCLAYEVYNLQVDENGMSRYRLNYAIRKPESDDEQSGEGVQKETLAYMWSSVKGNKGKEKPYIESSIEQSARASTAADIQIDIGALEKGMYLLVLGVEDLAAGTTAVESRIFTVSE
ncbi:MAG: hypothetical protein MZU95_00625 [Desulfomicrobium escambiense]|nr:hypothetical protein [Desulfomicrobium escambiense]